MPGDVAEPMLWGWLGRLVVPADIASEALSLASSLIAQERASGDLARVDTAALRRRLERLNRLYLDDELSDIEYDLEVQAIKRSLALAEPASLLRFNKERARSLLGDLPRLLEGGTLAERRAFVQALFDHVWLKDRSVVAVTPRADHYLLVASLAQAYMDQQTSVSLPPAMRRTVWSSSSGAQTSS